MSLRYRPIGRAIRGFNELSQSYLDKLRQVVRRYNSKDFLNAAIAVCALSAVADDEIAPDELYRIDQLILDDPALQEIDARKARQKLKEYLRELANNRAGAEKVLSDKVRRMADDHEKARTLMRIAYLIIVSDHEIRARERQEFKRLCGLLNLDSSQVWHELTTCFLLWDDPCDASLVRAPASAADIVNDILESKWRVFETLEDAKIAATELYQRAIEYHKKLDNQRDERKMERRLADLPRLTANEIPSVYD